MRIGPPTTFVSYSHDDMAFVLRLAKDLTAMGVNLWMDKFDIVGGQNRGAAIAAALYDSSFMLVILSPAYLASKDVLAQVDCAMDLGIQVIPVLIQECRIPYRIRHFQYVDFRGGYSAAGLIKLVYSLSRTTEMMDLLLTASTEENAIQEASERRLEELELEEQERRLEELEREYLKPSPYVLKPFPYVRGPEPPVISVDNVHFTLTGPRVLAPAMAHQLLFWLHLEQQTSTVFQLAGLMHRRAVSDLSIDTEGPHPLARGSRVSITLDIDGIACKENHKTMIWTGEIGRTSFVVVVPSNAHLGTYAGRALIRVNGCRVAVMSFVLSVGSPNREIGEIPSQTTVLRTAFASYASEDRLQVLNRVQGMEAAYKGLNVFMDVVDLRSGQDWEQKLLEHIAKSDTFYLFWCRHARKSIWVEKEWRYALASKGFDFIDPIPLEAPNVAPPPKELNTKHFNDPLLAFIIAAGGTHS